MTHRKGKAHNRAQNQYSSQLVKTVLKTVSGIGQKNAQGHLLTGFARFYMAALISAIFFLSDLSSP